MIGISPERLLRPWIFGNDEEIRSDGWFHFLSPVLYEVSNWVFNTGCLYGLALYLAGIVGIIGFALPNGSQKTKHFLDWRFSFLSIIGTLSAHLLNVIALIPILYVPRGAPIRPMGMASAEVTICGAAFLIGLPLAIAALVKERSKLLGIAAAMLCCTQLLFSHSILFLFAALRDLRLEE